jgi:hypothetical protein
MGSMFGFTIFNQNIGSWNTANVTDMSAMFRGASGFNQDIGSWDVTKVVDFTFMFGHNIAAPIVFNNGGSPNINNWVINSTQPVNMASMFCQNVVFNQPIGNWNTIQVTSMSAIFNASTAFNQNIGSWDVRNVANFGLFMGTKTPATYSAANLDAIYNGWSTRPVKPSLTITFGTAKYTAAGSAGRLILTGAPNNWVIIDGGI